MCERLTALAIAEAPQNADFELLSAWYENAWILRLSLKSERIQRRIRAQDGSISTLGLGITDGWQSDVDSVSDFRELGDLCAKNSEWDPTMACGRRSGNPFCGISGGLCASSALEESACEYRCDPEVYARMPFACRVGDLSGKYGRLEFHPPSLLPAVSGFSADPMKEPTRAATDQASGRVNLGSQTDEQKERRDQVGVKATAASKQGPPLSRLWAKKLREGKTEPTKLDAGQLVEAPDTKNGTEVPRLTVEYGSVRVTEVLDSRSGSVTSFPTIRRDGLLRILRIVDDPKSVAVELLRGRVLTVYDAQDQPLFCVPIATAKEVESTRARAEILLRLVRQTALSLTHLTSGAESLQQASEHEFIASSLAESPTRTPLLPTAQHKSDL